MENCGIGAGTFGAACGAEISLQIEGIALSYRISRSEVFLDLFIPSDWLVEKAFLFGIHTNWGSDFSATLSVGISNITGAKYHTLGFLSDMKKHLKVKVSLWSFNYSGGRLLYSLKQVLSGPILLTI